MPQRPFNFGSDDNYTQVWPAFRRNEAIYPLAHLNAHMVTYEAGEEAAYSFYVTYSHHCFCKTEEGINEEECWLYPHGKDRRNFNPARYELSKQLPQIISGLPTAITYHAGYDNYAICAVQEGEKIIYYQVVFVLFRSIKKFRLHVMSAYPIPSRPKARKVAFLKIASALKEGRKFPKPGRHK